MSKESPFKTLTATLMKKRSFSGKSTGASTSFDSTRLQERIAQKAYELYEQRGREPGHEVEDWLKAEAIITGKRKY